MDEISSTETMDKLLAATERLIYAGGICATGMDAIVKSSGVARKTIYRYFRTKDELVAEALRKRDERWMRWFIATGNKADGDIGDANTPIRAVAKEHKIKLRHFYVSWQKNMAQIIRMNWLQNFSF
jgi:AcrR family transcriptional regulator